MFRKQRLRVDFSTHKELLDIIPHPVKANKTMPDWFKKLKPQIPGTDIADAGTVKTCMPVMDACSEGYTILLWADLHVKVSKVYHFKDADGKVIHTEGGVNPDKLVGQDTSVTKERIESYEDTGELSVFMKFPQLDLGLGKLIGNHGWQQVGNACDLKKFKLGRVLLKLTNPWVITTSPGYSVFIKNPANDWSNEITLLEGMVDTDSYGNQINFPYVWTGGEVGEWIIPKGTPIAQVLIIKREDAELSVSSINKEKHDKVLKKMYTLHKDRYKKLFRHDPKARGKARCPFGFDNGD